MVRLGSPDDSLPVLGAGTRRARRSSEIASIMDKTLEVYDGLTAARKVLERETTRPCLRFAQPSIQPKGNPYVIRPAGVAVDAHDVGRQGRRLPPAPSR